MFSLKTCTQNFIPEEALATLQHSRNELVERVEELEREQQENDSERAAVSV